MDILAYELRDYVVDVHLQADTGLTLESCRLLNGGPDKLSPSCVYLVDNLQDAVVGSSAAGGANVDRPFPDGANLIVLDCVGADIRALDNVNVVFLSGISISKAVNLVLSTFDDYKARGERLEEAFTNSENLQTIVNIGTEIVGFPIAMLEMNHCALAMSTNMTPEGDHLWDAMADGYGYRHYSIIGISQPKLRELEESGEDVWENRNNISGRYIRVYLLRRGKRGVASLGFHKMYDMNKPFDKHTVQMADWFVQELRSRLDMFSEIKTGRGLFSESLMTDLLDGKEYDDEERASLLDVLSVEEGSRFYLGMILFKSENEHTEYDFALMDYLETLLDGNNCVEYDGRIVMLLPVHGEGSSTSFVLENDIPHFLNFRQCYCFLSSPFDSIFKMHRVYQIMDEVLPFVRRAESESETLRIYRYQEFACEHSVSLFLKHVPLQFAENEAVAKIIRADEQKTGKSKTEYYRTLSEYLNHFCNMAATADALCIHRNSLVYRLSKIEDIMGCSLEDPEFRKNVLFSIVCNEYAQREKENPDS